MSTISNDYIRREDAIDKINERQRKLIYCFGFENDAVKIMDIAKSIVTTIPAADVAPTPYTEPDLEQVREEAYEKGYENGFVAGHLKAEKSGQSFYEDGYKRGLADAWEAAKWLSKANAGVNFKIFGMHFTREIVQEISASECIEKIRQYEQEQEEIQVGDEVENTQTGARFIVTHMWVNNHGEKGVSGFNHECSAFSTALDLVRKTGRHFDEITTILQKMKE